MSNKQRKIALISSEFNRSITDVMRETAHQCLKQYAPNDLIIDCQVSGAVELPFAFQQMIVNAQVDGALILGCVIQGETDHYDYVCQMVANGVMEVSLKHQVPMGFGVITAQTMTLAKARAATKPQESVKALLNLLQLKEVPYAKN